MVVDGNQYRSRVTDTQIDSGETRPDSSDTLDKNVLMVAGVVVLGAIMSILDITVVSVALETFQREFDATAAEVAWTMTGYTLALASVIPLTGWAAAHFTEGRRRPEDLVLPEDRRHVGDAMARALAQDRPYAVEYRIRRRDGVDHVLGLLRPARQPDEPTDRGDQGVMDVVGRRRLTELLRVVLPRHDRLRGCVTKWERARGVGFAPTAPGD